MLKKIFIISWLVVISASWVYAKDSSASWLNGAELVTTLRLEGATTSLRDPADIIYLGTLPSFGYGIGAQSALLFPLNNSMSWGPNFNFSWNMLNNGSWYSFNVYQFGIGPMLKMDAASFSHFVFVNYNFGFLSTEGVYDAPAGLHPAPAGSFVANVPGYTLGWYALFPISDSLIIGPYLSYGVNWIAALKYKHLNIFTTPNKYENRWMDVGLNNYIRAGVSILFGPLSPVF